MLTTQGLIQPQQELVDFLWGSDVPLRQQSVPLKQAEKLSEPSGTPPVLASTQPGLSPGGGPGLVPPALIIAFDPGIEAPDTGRQDTARYK